MHQHFHATHGQGTGSPVTFSIAEILSKENSKDNSLPACRKGFFDTLLSRSNKLLRLITVEEHHYLQYAFIASCINCAVPSPWRSIFF